MKLRRGDIVTVAAKGPYTGKPRPAAIVQAEDTLEYRDRVTVVPLTTVRAEAPDFRIPLRAGSIAGLDVDSYLMVDKVITVPKTALGPQGPIGHLTELQISALNRALRFWLDL